MNDHHERMMRRAIELAAIARGDTRPNPLVGCVVTRGETIIAEGYHRRAGEAHAEVDALQKLQAGDAHGADLYVNLEPCSTHGRTPPCTDAILAAGIARVFVGAVDTNPRHLGAGLHTLRDAGIEVVTGVLETESRRLNAAYFSTMERGRPFVTAKWAMSLDGKIATRTGDSAWITNATSRDHVHELRGVHDAIMVGTQTLLHDDPRLTCRLEGRRDPIRIVLDAELKAPATARVFDTPGTIVAHRAGLDFSDYEARGARSIALDTVDGRLPLLELLEQLVAHHVMSVFVEGGGTLLGSLFDADLIDRVYAFIAPRLIGGRDAIPALGGLGAESMDGSVELSDVRVERFGDDVLVVGDIWSCLPAS